MIRSFGSPFLCVVVPSRFSSSHHEVTRVRVSVRVPVRVEVYPNPNPIETLFAQVSQKEGMGKGGMINTIESRQMQFKTV